MPKSARAAEQSCLKLSTATSAAQRGLGRRQDDSLQLAESAAGSLAAFGLEKQQLRVTCV